MDDPPRAHRAHQHRRLSGSSNWPSRGIEARRRRQTEADQTEHDRDERTALSRRAVCLGPRRREDRNRSACWSSERSTRVAELAGDSHSEQSVALHPPVERSLRISGGAHEVEGPWPVGIVLALELRGRHDSDRVARADPRLPQQAREQGCTLDHDRVPLTCDVGANEGSLLSCESEHVANRDHERLAESTIGSPLVDFQESRSGLLQ